MRKMKIKCFLSYNSSDNNFAKKLAIDLIENNIDVWFDRWKIYAGESIIGKVEEGISTCDYFLILMSPNSMKSKWVKKELQLGLNNLIEKNKIRIVPLLLKNCNIPPFLKDHRYVDFRNKHNSALSDLLDTLLGRAKKPIHSKKVLTFEGWKSLLAVDDWSGNSDISIEIFKILSEKVKAWDFLVYRAENTDLNDCWEETMYILHSCYDFLETDEDKINAIYMVINRAFKRTLYTEDEKKDWIDKLKDLQ